MRPSLPARILLVLIRAYQLTLSAWIGRQCRYLPTCSAYAADAVRAHGAWAGGWMGLARLCRCHPLGGSGYDPAPVDRPPAPLWAPWRLGDWRGPRPATMTCEEIKP
jgi:putative membrane protein insertion efficiency factor